MTDYSLFEEPRCKRCTEPTTTPLCWACLATVTSWSAWDIEYWLPVAGREGYEVSNLGRGRSLDRVVVDRNGQRRRRKGQALKASRGTGGYPMMGFGVSVRVYRPVLESFSGPCPPGLEACHANDIKTDNRLCNLRWDTHRANGFDAYRNGCHDRPRRAKARCRNGHDYTPENTYIDHKGHRRCCQCHVAAYLRKRDGVNARRRERSRQKQVA